MVGIIPTSRAAQSSLLIIFSLKSFHSFERIVTVLGTIGIYEHALRHALKHNRRCLRITKNIGITKNPSFQ